MGGGATAIFFDPGEREIDTGRDAGRCVDVPVLHPKLWRDHLDARVALGELAAEAPMCGPAATTEQAGFGKEKSADADCTEATQAIPRVLEPGEEGSAAGVAAGETADQQRGGVLVRDILQPSMRQERHDASFARYLQISCGGDDFDNIDGPAGEAIHRAEDL